LRRAAQEGQPPQLRADAPREGRVQPHRATLVATDAAGNRSKATILPLPIVR
jgi:hypothetical protein